jgi:hypothetical protein
MTKVIYATLEPCVDNTDSSSATIYFDGLPTEGEVRDAFEKFAEHFLTSQKSPPNLGVMDLEWAHVPNALSNHRYQCQVG